MEWAAAITSGRLPPIPWAPIIACVDTRRLRPGFMLPPSPTALRRRRDGYLVVHASDAFDGVGEAFGLALEGVGFDGARERGPAVRDGGDYPNGGKLRVVFERLVNLLPEPRVVNHLRRRRVGRSGRRRRRGRRRRLLYDDGRGLHGRGLRDDYRRRLYGRLRDDHWGLRHGRRLRRRAHVDVHRGRVVARVRQE